MASPSANIIIWAEDKELMVATGIKFPAWVYNGFLPGPTLRATEGDRLLVHFENRATKPHTIHFHGIHPANMDGVFEIVPQGKTFTYDFTAEPFGLFPFHCHMMPLRKHIARGLYGTLIVDPPAPRPPATEMIMVMHGLDVNLDMENDFYAVNGYANYYAEHPITLKVGEKVRIYLTNMTEFDLVNNFHLHANMFDYYPNGTSLQPAELHRHDQPLPGPARDHRVQLQISRHVHVSRSHLRVRRAGLDGLLPREGMNTTAASPEFFNRLAVVSAIVPLILLGGLVYWFFHGGSRLIERAVPPIEEVSIRRVEFAPGEIKLTIRNTGPMPVEMTLVTVDEAIWKAEFSPGRRLARLARGDGAHPVRLGRRRSLQSRALHIDRVVF